MYEIKINDLRSLAKAGNATVRLDQAYHFEIGKIQKDGIYVPAGFAIVNGRKTELKTCLSFHTIFPHIETIKKGQVLIAEKRAHHLVATWKFEKTLANKE